MPVLAPDCDCSSCSTIACFCSHRTTVPNIAFSCIRRSRRCSTPDRVRAVCPPCSTLLASSSVCPYSTPARATHCRMAAFPHLVSPAVTHAGPSHPPLPPLIISRAATPSSVPLAACPPLELRSLPVLHPPSIQSPTVAPTAPGQHSLSRTTLQLPYNTRFTTIPCHPYSTTYPTTTQHPYSTPSPTTWQHP